MTDSDADSADGKGTFGSIAESECRALLSVGIIGRVAFNSSSGIQIIPLNYIYLDDRIYVRVDATSVLGELGGDSNEVAFEVDYHDDLNKRAWSVVVQGSMEVVTDPGELQTLQSQRRLKPWAIGKRQLYLRLEPLTISGRKVKRKPR